MSIPSTRRVFFGGLLAAIVLGSAGCAALAPAPTLGERIAQDPELSTFSRLVQRAGMEEVLRGEAALTALAPSDEAFRALPQRTLDEIGADPARARAVVSNHLVDGRTPAAEMKGKVRTRAGAELAVSRTGDFVALDEALIVQADLPARNGLVDKVDRVLMPPKK